MWIGGRHGLRPDRHRRRRRQVAATEISGLAAVFDLGVTSGSLDGFADSDVAISEEFADDRGLAVGSSIDDLGRR